MAVVSGGLLSLGRVPEEIYTHVLRILFVKFGKASSVIKKYV